MVYDSTQMHHFVPTVEIKYLLSLFSLFSNLCFHHFSVIIARSRFGKWRWVYSPKTNMEDVEYVLHICVSGV